MRKTQREITDSYLFSGNREKAIQRDSESCVGCGMTREQHKLKYKRDLTVDHIDGKGCHLPLKERNNALENLQTLCLSCHGKKDIRRSPNTHPKKIAQYTLTGNLIKVFPDLKSINEELGVHISGVNHCVTGDQPTAYGYIWKHYDSLLEQT